MKADRSPPRVTLPGGCTPDENVTVNSGRPSPRTAHLEPTSWLLGHCAELPSFLHQGRPDLRTPEPPGLLPPPLQGLRQSQERHGGESRWGPPGGAAGSWVLSSKDLTPGSATFRLPPPGRAGWALVQGWSLQARAMTHKHPHLRINAKASPGQRTKFNHHTHAPELPGPQFPQLSSGSNPHNVSPTMSTLMQADRAAFKLRLSHMQAVWPRGHPRLFTCLLLTP